MKTQSPQTHPALTSSRFLLMRSQDSSFRAWLPKHCSLQGGLPPLLPKRDQCAKLAGMGEGEGVPWGECQGCSWGCPLQSPVPRARPAVGQPPLAQLAPHQGLPVSPRSHTQPRPPQITQPRPTSPDHQNTKTNSAPLAVKHLYGSHCNRDFQSANDLLC